MEKSSCSKLTISICMLGSSQYSYFYNILKVMQNTWKLLFTATLGSEEGINHSLTALQINSNLQKNWELPTEEIKYTAQREPRQNHAPIESLPHGSPSWAFSQATLHYTLPIIKGPTSSHLTKACQTLRKTFNKEKVQEKPTEKVTFFFLRQLKNRGRVEKETECFNLLLPWSLERIN